MQWTELVKRNGACRTVPEQNKIKMVAGMPFSYRRSYRATTMQQK